MKWKWNFHKMWQPSSFLFNLFKFFSNWPSLAPKNRHLVISVWNNFVAFYRFSIMPQNFRLQNFIITNFLLKHIIKRPFWWHFENNTPVTTLHSVNILLMFSSSSIFRLLACRHAYFLHPSPWSGEWSFTHTGNLQPALTRGHYAEMQIKIQSARVLLPISLRHHSYMQRRRWSETEAKRRQKKKAKEVQLTRWNVVRIKRKRQRCMPHWWFASQQQQK